jgi:hypothetical protein
MMDKQQIKFAKRPQGHGPFVVGSYAQGDRICHDIEIGNQVSLEAEDVTVLVRIEAINGTGYVGTIESFENYMEETYKGHSQGDKVEFTYDEIHGCIR